jgi:hypothetical protein
MVFMDQGFGVGRQPRGILHLYSCLCDSKAYSWLPGPSPPAQFRAVLMGHGYLPLQTRKL